MSEEMARSIRFPVDLWKAIDEDAKRCKRSSVKQMEAVLSAYYELGDVDLNRQKLEFINRLKPESGRKMPAVEILGEIDPQGGKDLPHFEIDLGEKKKKKRA